MLNNHQILDKKRTIQKIKRIAFQIYENNFQETEIIFVGIADMGYILAGLLQKEFDGIAGIHSSLVKLTMFKPEPLREPIGLSADIDTFNNKVVILVDDVLNTGKTLIYGLKPFFNIPIKKMQTVVLVNRDHKLFPISADYVGYSLSTTINENIKVELEDEDHFGVYLS